MKNFKIPRLNQATPEIQLSINQSFEAMEPYLDILDSENGILAKIMVSSLAQAKSMGIANDEDFEVVIQKASSITGIPIESFQLYAKSAIAMFESSILVEMR